MHSESQVRFKVTQWIRTTEMHIVPCTFFLSLKAHRFESCATITVSITFTSQKKKKNLKQNQDHNIIQQRTKD